MKLGQLLSLQTQALPEEAITELANLQMHAPGMHPTLARAQFKSSLGKDPDEVFRRFEEEPFAAASLGQVHRAITRAGETVAVKIQYPAIRAAIESDLKLLRSATLFDVYTGEPIPAGKKSLTYSLVYQSQERTLTDAEANTLQEKIISDLNEKFGAVLRS